MAPKSKRPAGRTDGENEGEEVVAQSARSNVGHKHGRTNQDPVRGGQVGKRATILPRVVGRGNGPPIPPLVMKEGEVRTVRRKSWTRYFFHEKLERREASFFLKYVMLNQHAIFLVYALLSLISSRIAV